MIIMAALVAKRQKYPIVSWLCLRTRLEPWFLGLFSVLIGVWRCGRLIGLPKFLQ